MPDRLRWPALVLTAGLGTRFRPLSFVRAKPAAPVAGIPLVGRVLAWLHASGVEDVVLNLHHCPETVTAVVGDGRAYGVRVRYSYENPILGSAGGPARALSLVDAPRFFIINGDTLCPVDLDRLAAGHEAHRASVTMALVANPDPARYGGVVVDAAGCVTRFSARTAIGEPNGWHYPGIQIVESAVFAGVPDDRPSETVRELYPDLIRKNPGSVRAYITEASFHDIGTPADYLEASLELARAEGLGDLPRGARCSIASSARLIRTAVWDDVTIGENCELVDCIVADGVVLPPGTRLRRMAVVNDIGYPDVPGAVREHGLLLVPLGGAS